MARTLPGRSGWSESLRCRIDRRQVEYKVRGRAWEVIAVFHELLREEYLDSYARAGGIDWRGGDWYTPCLIYVGHLFTSIGSVVLVCSSMCSGLVGKSGGIHWRGGDWDTPGLIYMGHHFTSIWSVVLVPSSMCCLRSRSIIVHAPVSGTNQPEVCGGSSCAQDSSKVLGSLTTQLQGGWGRAKPSQQEGLGYRRQSDRSDSFLCRERNHQRPKARPSWGVESPMPSSCRRRCRKKQQHHEPLPWATSPLCWKSSRKTTRCSLLQHSTPRQP